MCRSVPPARCGTVSCCGVTRARRARGAGDVLIGADGMQSAVRKWVVAGPEAQGRAGGVRDGLESTGRMQWQGRFPDPAMNFRAFDEAVTVYAGRETVGCVHRLPIGVVNWSLTRPAHLESANALAEWRVLMRDWAAGPDGGVEIPPAQQMRLREVFNLFDADRHAAPARNTSAPRPHPRRLLL
jgi:2-polyprenyl-6-methoxyphenol hydroxylase-like FAD-dependent oxidoreductase